jgi:signal transduction histidine kinase
MPALTLGRQEPRPTATKRTPDGLRVLRLAVAAVGLHRGITLTTVLAGDADIISASMAVAYAAVAVWSCGLVWDGWRQGRFRSGLATVDVMVASAVGLPALAWGSPGMRFGYGVLQGAAIVAGCTLPARAVTVAVSALVSVKFLAVLVPPESGGATATECLAYAVTLAVLALAATAAHRLLRLAADAADRRHTGPTGAAREQAEQQRMLHDTALATLTAIARGGLDVHADEVRARCARDAAYLRLMMQGGQPGPGSLPVALATAAQEAAAVGLRVHPICDALPADLDPVAVSAIARAVREALNNVHRHARTGEAWLSAAEEGGTVVVRVVDRGSGFTPARVVEGSGIRDSILGRMREIGGAALVESAPAQGTCVELRWPR